MSRANLSTTLNFSEEQAMLLDTASGFFREQSPTSAVRERMTTESGYDAQMWARMVELGWTGLAIPEEQGGSDLGLGAAVCIAEPMGRHLAASPWLACQIFVQGVRAGRPGHSAAALEALAAGAIGTVALFEGDGDWRLDEPSVEITRTGDRFALKGTKTLVLDAAVADYFLVSGRHAGEPALVLLQRDDLPPAALSRETVIDETRRSFALTLDGCEVGSDALLTGRDARQALAAMERTAWLLLAAEAAGGTAGVLELTVEYLNTRTAFGRKIGSYQALKHPMVDILIGLERARSHLYHAATLVDLTGRPAPPDPQTAADLEAALRMAKAQAGEVYAFAGDRAIQFHGGFGFTWECDAQLFARRALWIEHTFGDVLHHRRRLAGLLL